MSGRTLVIGGAGFVGGWLTRALAEDGVEVDVLDDLSRGVRDRFLEDLEARPNVRVISGSILDPATTDALGDGYARIYHLAAILGVQMVRDRPYDTLTLNNGMLVAALELAKRQKALERFVFSSTSEVYAGTLIHHGLDFPTPEDTPLSIAPMEEPRTSYMLSKIYGEMLCLHAGVPATVVRPHNFYGPRMGLAHVAPQMLQRAHQASDGDEFAVYSADHQRTFCYVDDAVRLLRALAEADGAEGGVFNIGAEEPELTIEAFARLVVDTVGRDLTLVPEPATPGSPLRRCPSMAKTTGVTGMRAEIDPAEGLRRTYAWYRDHVFAEGGVSAV